MSSNNFQRGLRENLVLTGPMRPKAAKSRDINPSAMIGATMPPWQAMIGGVLPSKKDIVRGISK